MDEARDVAVEALTMFHEAENPSGMALMLQGLAHIETMLGRTERALRLAGAADAVREAIGGGAPPELLLAKDPRATARGQMRQEEIGRAWDEGRSMSLEEALSYALEDGMADSSDGEKPLQT